MMLAGNPSLIAALEARDQDNRGHSEAVAGLVARKAALRNPDHDEIGSLGIAGRLHDPGKIGVPDAILLKPGHLILVSRTPVFIPGLSPSGAGLVTTFSSLGSIRSLSSLLSNPIDNIFQAITFNN